MERTRQQRLTHQQVTGRGKERAHALILVRPSLRLSISVYPCVTSYQSIQTFGPLLSSTLILSCSYASV